MITLTTAQKNALLEGSLEESTNWKLYLGSKNRSNRIYDSGFMAADADQTSWTGDATVDTANKLFGNNSLKFNSSATHKYQYLCKKNSTGGMFYLEKNVRRLEIGKRYVMSYYYKMVSYTGGGNIQILLDGHGGSAAVGAIGIAGSGSTVDWTRGEFAFTATHASYGAITPITAVLDFSIATTSGTLYIACPMLHEDIQLADLSWFGEALPYIPLEPYINTETDGGVLLTNVMAGTTISSKAMFDAKDQISMPSGTIKIFNEDMLWNPTAYNDEFDPSAEKYIGEKHVDGFGMFRPGNRIVGWNSYLDTNNVAFTIPIGVFVIESIRTNILDGSITIELSNYWSDLSRNVAVDIIGTKELSDDAIRAIVLLSGYNMEDPDPFVLCTGSFNSNNVLLVDSEERALDVISNIAQANMKSIYVDQSSKLIVRDISTSYTDSTITLDEDTVVTADQETGDCVSVVVVKSDPIILKEPQGEYVDDTKQVGNIDASRFATGTPYSYTLVDANVVNPTALTPSSGFENLFNGTTKVSSHNPYMLAAGAQSESTPEYNAPYVEIDLGQGANPVGAIHLWFDTRSNQNYYFKVTASLNRQTWWYLAGETNKFARSNPNSFTDHKTVVSGFPTQYARYLRVYMNGSDISTSNGIFDIQVLRESFQTSFIGWDGTGYGTVELSATGIKTWKNECHIEANVTFEVLSRTGHTRIRGIGISSEGDPILNIAGTASSGFKIYDGGVSAYNCAGDKVFHVDTSNGNLCVTGTLCSCAGTIGGWTLGANSLTAGTGTSSVGMQSLTSAGCIAFYAGHGTPGSAPFRVTNEGCLVASNATVCGTFCSTSGNIGGWCIASGCLYATNAYLYSGVAETARIEFGTGAYAAGINSASGTGCISMWAGCAHAGRAGAPFRVTADGCLFASNATICGCICSCCGAIGGFTIGATRLTAGATNATAVGISSGGDSCPAFWTGNLAGGSALVKILHNGCICAECANIGGFEVVGSSNGFCAGSATTTVAMKPGVGIWLGATAFADGIFKVSQSGHVTATDGLIGYWCINSSAIFRDNGANSAGMVPTDYPFYAGCALTGRATAPFRVSIAGAVTATSGNIGGFNLGTTNLTAGSGSGSGYNLWISNATTGSGYFYSNQAILQGFSQTWHYSDNAGHLVLGQIATNANTVKTDYFGIQMMDHVGNEYFALSTKLGTNCAVQHNRIGGTCFTSTAIFSTNFSTGSAGWCINNGGCAEFMAGNIAGWSISSTHLCKCLSATKFMGLFACGVYNTAPTIVIAGCSNGSVYHTFGGEIYNGAWLCDTWGMVLRSGGNNLFQVHAKPDGTCQCASIAGWDFNSLWIGKTTNNGSNSKQIIMDSANSSFYTGCYCDGVGWATMVSLGNVYESGTGFTGHYGVAGYSGTSRLFELSTRCSEIAGWNFVAGGMYKSFSANTNIFVGSYQPVSYGTTYGPQISMWANVSGAWNAIQIGRCLYDGSTWIETNGAIFVQNSTEFFRSTMSDAGVLCAHIAGWNFNSACLYANNICLNSAGAIGTTNFASGLRGWCISCTGIAEFASAIVRGELRTSVFRIGEVHAVGGCVFIQNADATDTEICVGVPGDWFYFTAGSGFAVNEVVRIKAITSTGVADVWGHVIGFHNIAGDRYCYCVYQDYGSSTTVIPKKTAIVSYGATTAGGGIFMDGVSKYMDIFSHAGSPWLGLTPQVRLGDLSGISGMSGYGLWTNNGNIVGGLIRSNNWTTNDGSCFDLACGCFKIGGSSSPKLSWDGSALTVCGTICATSGTFTGTVCASCGVVGGFAITSTTLSSSDYVLGLSRSVSIISCNSSSCVLTFLFSFICPLACQHKYCLTYEGVCHCSDEECTFGPSQYTKRCRMFHSPNMLCFNYSRYLCGGGCSCCGISTIVPGAVTLCCFDVSGCIGPLSADYFNFSTTRPVLLNETLVLGNAAGQLQFCGGSVVGGIWTGLGCFIKIGDWATGAKSISLDMSTGTLYVWCGFVSCGASSVDVSANSTWAFTAQNCGSTNAHGIYVNIGASSTGIPIRIDKNGSPVFEVLNDQTSYFSSYMYFKDQAANYILTCGTNTATGVFGLQSGGGSGGFGGSLVMYSHAHATRPGSVVVGLSNGAAACFAVTDSGLAGGNVVFSADYAGNLIAAGSATINGGRITVNCWTSAASCAVWVCACTCGVVGIAGSVNGVYGYAAVCFGVYGLSYSCGVVGYATCSVGVGGVSEGNYGVHGLAYGCLGVYGYAASCRGVMAVSGCDHGLYATANGAYPVSGNGAYYDRTSNRQYKIKTGDVIGVIESLKSVSIEKWMYHDRNQKGFDEFIGPYDNEWRDAFGLHHDDGIYAHSIAGVAIAGVKELTSCIEKQDSCIILLNSCISGFEERINKLESMIGEK